MPESQATETPFLLVSARPSYAASKRVRELYPFVSVIMPVRNEEMYIERSLGAMLSQDYPHDRYEILVVDGMSTDRMREFVEVQAQGSDVEIRLLDNPRRIVPTAMNIGVRHARGGIVVRMDGHAVADPDYLRLCVRTLLSRHVDNVGGVVDFVGENLASEASAIAATSLFGMGGAPARRAIEGEVDTVSFGCWRREHFDKFGYFDDAFVRTQDSEFNYRTRVFGGKVWMNPDIRSTYFCRSSFGRLTRQYLSYGVWKARLFHKLGALAWRHLAPPLFVLGLLACVLLAPVALSRAPAPLCWLPVGLPLFYLCCCFAAAVVNTIGHRFRLCLATAVVFPIMHLAWGLGFLYGLVYPGGIRRLRRLRAPAGQATASENSGEEHEACQIPDHA